jgi:NAD(P)-dependent dehydrogenase (short-subunit alcohol dehydrogenase family)
MTPSHALIVGGSSGMGLALAELLVADGSLVTIAGRSADRLRAAASRLGRHDLVRTRQVDVADEEQVRSLFADAGRLDHVVVTAADAVGAYAPLREFDLKAARAVVDVKLLGAWLVAKHAVGAMAPGGSITFTSGIAAYRPGPGSSIIAASNGALEALARSLALELAPVRVNVVSPGWIDTPIWETLAGDGKGERLAGMARRLPVERVGQPIDVARAFVAVMHNEFITGTLLHVDGGHRLV